MAPPNAGALVTIEGIDGTGKSTVAADLGRYLEELHVRAALQREPTPLWLGRAVRDGQAHRVSPMTLTFLFLADRAEHVRTLSDLLAAGTVVLCDRYMDSTTAYQGASLQGVLPEGLGDPVEWVWSLQRPWAIVPHLTLLLVDDPAACVERVRKRSGTTELFEDAAFLSQVQQNYRAVASREPARFRLVGPGPVDAVKQAARGHLRAFLSDRGLLKGP